MATRTISVAGGNWNATSSWDEGAIPVAGDDVVARSGGDSGNITVNVVSACATIILTNYTGTLTYNNTLTTTGAVTYPSGMTIAGTADHVTVTGSTFNIAPILTGGLRLGGTSQTYTLARDLVLNGTLLFNGVTAITFSGSFNITAGAFNDTMSVSAITMSGNITITGNCIFNSATSTTISGGFAWLADTCTVSNGQTMNITSIGSMTVTGLTTSGTAANVFTGGIWNTGGLSVTGTTSGTTVFNITGGTWSGAADTLSNSVTIAGNVTLGDIIYAASGTPTLTYSSGTVTVGSSTFTINSSCTINGMQFFNLTLAGALTLTCNTRFTCNGTLTLPNAAVTFAGSSGWTVANITNTALTASRTTTFTAGNEYIITNNLTNNNTDLPTEKHTWVSSSGTTKALITLQENATQDIGFFDVTRIDSSNGQTIFSYLGVITDSFGWSNSLSGGNIVKSFTGATLTVSGITKDKNGNALGSCTVYLFKDNGNNSATFMASTTSHASTGAYSFTVFVGSTYFVVAFKNGSPNVFDTTDRTIVAA